MMEIISPDQQQIENVISQNAAAYRDQVVENNELNVSVHENETVYAIGFNTDKHLKFSSSALGQLLNRLRIPSLFYERCPPQLQADIINHFNNEYEKGYLFRFNEASTPNYVRAVLSDRYGIIDNTELFPLIFESLQKRDDIVYRKFECDEKITKLLLDFADCRTVFKEKSYTAGLSIINSETGHSSVWIEPTVHLSASVSLSNRTILRKQGVNCRAVHRGNLSGERIAPMIEEAKEIAQVGILQTEEAYDSYISTEHALRSVTASPQCPNRWTTLLEVEWKEQKEISRAKVATRLVELAQELPLFTRIQVEQEAGKLMKLYQNYSSRMANVMQMISS